MAWIGWGRLPAVEIPKIFRYIIVNLPFSRPAVEHSANISHSRNSVTSWLHAMNLRTKFLIMLQFPLSASWDSVHVVFLAKKRCAQPWLQDRFAPLAKRSCEHGQKNRPPKAAWVATSPESSLLRGT
ncbi:MAG: hypothetical protein HQL97_11965 [Magnetococcales bacterium]|nr:hypothetical protein [Magnetococcales bacterium]